VLSNALDHTPLGDGVLMAGAIGLASSVGLGAVMEYGGRYAARALGHAAEDAEGDLAHGAEEAAGEAACPLSFAPGTPVATPSGARPIAALKVGDRVVAYDPKTGQTTAQTVQHVWIHHDTDLIDLTLRSDGGPAARAPVDLRKVRAALVGDVYGRAPPVVGGLTDAASRGRDEVVHTTAKHPFLTGGDSWVAAGDLAAGMRVVRADGTPAVVVGMRAVPGAAAMWNLTVSQVHTYAVGAGQYVVHNCGSGATRDDPFEAHLPRERYPETAGHIEDAVANGQPDITQWDPSMAGSNRRASLKGWATRRGVDRDEWPMASTRQGGKGADIRYILSSDNRGAGSYIAKQLARLPGRGDGTWFRLVIDG
jgi:hypothetical protein